jgi:hypothetical protein
MVILSRVRIKLMRLVLRKKAQIVELVHDSYLVMSCNSDLMTLPNSQ